MSRVLADLVAYAKQHLRSPTATFFTLFFPIVLVVVFGGVFGNPEEINLEVHVQDLDGTDTSRELMDVVNQTGVTIVPVSPSEDLAGFIRNQSIPVALQIPAGFEAEVGSALAGNPFARPTVVLYGDTSSSTFQTVGGAVSGAVTGFNFGLSGATPYVQLDTETISQETSSALDFFIPGIMGIAVLTPIFFTSATAAEYRERKYFKLLATTPLRKSEFLLSRMVWSVGILYVSIVLLILVAWAAFGTLYALDWISVVLIGAGSVLFASIGMAIGSFAKSADAASAVANIVYFPMMFLTGTFFPLELMPDFMRAVSRVLPLTYFNEGLRDTLIFGNVAGAMADLALVGVLAIVFFVLSAWSLAWRAE